MIIGHGGNIGHLSRKLGCKESDITDMSSNLNPMGPPEDIKPLICSSIDHICSLPEPDALSMRKGFASYNGISENNVVAANGTTWFIYTLPAALDIKKILILGPTYSDYKDACQMHGIAFEHCIMTAQGQFAPDMDNLSDMCATADMVFICNPNNPTGALIPKDNLVFLIKKHPGTLFVIDESYLPFVEEAQEISFVSDKGYDNLVVLSSMSKIFRIPGLRTGFLSAPETVCDKIMAFYQPWSVNSLAQTVIRHIFDHPEKIEPFYKKTRQFIKEQIALFLDDLEGVKQLKCFKTHAYFILAKLTGPMKSSAFCEQIGQHKILIRDCANFHGLTHDYVRFSLKHRQDNRNLAQKIRQVLGHA